MRQVDMGASERVQSGTKSNFRMRFIWTLSIALLQFLKCGAGWAAGEVGAGSGVEFFEKKVRPILAQHCYECHSGQAKKLKANLYLDTREGLLKGGDTGVAIVLGEPEKSRLIEAVRYGNPDFQMPPKQKLSDAAIGDLIEWIKMGAPWPATAMAIAGVDENAPEAEREQRKREHWAWQPVGQPPVPIVMNVKWPKTTVDHFILAGLESRGLAPAPAADRRSLIRRAYFDLIGLPPSPEEVEEFLKNQSADAFEKVIDQLLASPHYGERMGRHWLDVARYGEDQAHNFQPRLYPQGFRYRDWLVQAINRDLPYDRFLVEQIAGDLIEEEGRDERIAALGFFAVGPVYYGDRKMFDQWDDRVDTLTRGVLGLTVACARCHDHKFDPVSARDYYALAGVFASSEYVEAPLVPEEVVAEYQRGQAAIESKNKEIEMFIERQALKVAEERLGQLAEYLAAAWRLEQEENVDQVIREAGLDKAVLERFRQYLRSEATRKRDEFSQWQMAVSAKASDIIQRAAEALEGYFLSLAQLRRTTGEFEKAAAAITTEKSKLSGPKLDEARVTALDELIGKTGVFTPGKNQVEKLMAPALQSQLAGMRRDLESARKSAPAKYPFAHALKEGQARNLPLLVRGNPEAPGEEVPRGFLAFLSGDERRIFKSGSGRLELARAIADARNPLTARVMVNRIWQQHFGRGLVRSPNNFGALGERPTHPELLDHLARQFVRSGWSIKFMHRLIMQSAAYQMSSLSASDGGSAGAVGMEMTVRAQQLDAENRWLWRQNRRRLEVEAWRDAMLAVSGALDRKVGGVPSSLASPDHRRRTLYASVSRHDLDPLLRLFDFPDPNVTSDQRASTTVPLQQLFVLNSEFMARQARALAQRLLRESGSTEMERIDRAFLLVYGRPAREAERVLGLRFLGGQTLHVPEGAREAAFGRWEQYAQVLLSANEFMYVD